MRLQDREGEREFHRSVYRAAAFAEIRDTGRDTVRSANRVGLQFENGAFPLGIIIRWIAVDLGGGEGPSPYSLWDILKGISDREFRD